MEGLGTYVWPDNRIYTGSWINNKMEGKGKYVWPGNKNIIRKIFIYKKYFFFSYILNFRWKNI